MQLLSLSSDEQGDHRQDEGQQGEAHPGQRPQGLGISPEHRVAVKTAPVNENGKNGIIVDFGSRNSFGGMVRSEAIGFFDNETCEAVLLSIE